MDRAQRSRTGSNTNRGPNRRSGCVTCRRRRVRCDERQNVCDNCSRLGLSCMWYLAGELTHRSRVNTACGRCRKKKIRFTPLSSRLPERAEIRRLLDAYFAGPHYFCYYTFIHQPTMEQMLDNDRIPDSLLFIVIATSLHFLEPGNPLPDQWADECRCLIMQEIFSPPSTTTLQALLLLQRYEWHRANHISAWFLSGLAVRLAHGLQLNIEILDTARVPATVREIRRRLAWCCLVMESMIEAGRQPLSAIDKTSLEVRLPCDERSFRLGLETNMPDVNHLLETPAPLSNPSEGHAGISAFLVRLAVLRRDILDYTLPYHPRNRGHIPSQEPWSPDSAFFRCEKQLGEWSAALPVELQFNVDVLYRRRPQLVNFLALHCLFHGCYCDLYRIGSYINTSYRASSSGKSLSPQGESFLVTCRRGRLQHAMAICQVISESMQHHNLGHDPVVAIGAALAMRVLIIERKPDDSAALGLTDETVHVNVDAAVQCAKEVARRSVPIRELFCSVCALAGKYGYNVDISDLYMSGRGTTTNHQPQDQSRAESPSLRTYGTFGKIQSSLDRRGDLLAPAASSSTDRDSDLFSNLDPSPTSTAIEEAIYRDLPLRADPVLAEILPAGVVSRPWDMGLSTIDLTHDNFSPSDLGIAPGWQDGMFNFSMMPSQMDWINQSLDFDFDDSML
ncbi:fungal-specific transcription factor domain-containing protein [Mariannaea sp. PMI_226]|nr:fungal-specific transcription factor domain-containing protein [Mariannaea sp. PMI_226]